MQNTLFDIMVRHAMLAEHHEAGWQPNDTPPLDVEKLLAHYVQDVRYLLNELRRRLREPLT